MTATAALRGKAHHIAILLHSLEGGGAQRRIVTLANAFVRMGRRVDIILVDGGGELVDELSPAIRLFTLGGRSPARRREIIEDLAGWLALEKPDALLSGAAAVHSLAVAARANAPQIPLLLRASSHPFRPIPWSKPGRRLRESIERRIRARCYAQGDAILAVSDEVAAAVRRLAPKVVTSVTHNPVITANFRAGAKRSISLPWDADPDIPLIISIGRNHAAKDFPTLVRAFALLRKNRRARLVIIGSGLDDRRGKALRALVDSLGIGGDVALLGPTNAIAAWLAQADLFVSSSLWEGSPGVLIEAMAMGCPVVATDCPGSSREVLQDGRIGRLVPIRAPMALASAMAAELDDPTAQEALIAASEPYREEGRAEEHLAAIDRCVKAVAGRAWRKKPTNSPRFSLRRAAGHWTS